LGETDPAGAAARQRDADVARAGLIAAAAEVEA
jgi:hypothetical protein